MKQVDVDTLLAKNELELTLAGKKYRIKDVPMAIFMETARGDVEKDKDLLHKQLASVLNVDVQELKDKNVGIKAASLTLNAIREWLTDDTPEIESDEKAGASKAKNP